MRGFASAICAWAWAPHTRAASGASGELLAPSNVASSPAEPTLPAQTDLLITDSARYQELYSVQALFAERHGRALFTEKNGLAPEDVERVFCIDLNLGCEFEDWIYSSLNSAFYRTGARFGSFLLSRCVERLKMSNSLLELFSEYCRCEALDVDVEVTFKDNADLSVVDQNRVRMVLNGMFKSSSSRNRNVHNGRQIIKFEKFSVEIAQPACSGGYDCLRFSRLISGAYPDVFLTYASWNYLDFLRVCFDAMLRKKIPREVKYDELRSYQEIFKRQGWKDRGLVGSKEELLRGMVGRGAYQDYYDFNQRVFLKNKQEDNAKAN